MVLIDNLKIFNEKDMDRSISTLKREKEII